MTVRSPNGGLHVVRTAATRTACGLDYRATRRRAVAGKFGWTRVLVDFDVLAARGAAEVCQRCQECLAEGMGPGAEAQSVR
jgi:hypothetical protein